MIMKGRLPAWIITILAFVVCLPPGFFFGIILIGHGRLVPYVSVWVDRLVLVVTTLRLPLLVSFGVLRFVSRRGCR